MRLHEHDLQNAIRLRLSALGWVVFRTNVGKVHTADGRWFDTGLPRGFSDLFACSADGRVVFIECKVKPNAPSPEQLNFIGQMQSRGFKAGVCYTVEEAVALCS